ncbi:MAG: cytochrome c [Pseudomonadota bacterium]
MKKFVIAAAVLGLACGQVYASGNVAAGKKKVDEVCSSCHGKDGRSENPMFPKLAGQNESYIVHALHAYKKGDRKNPIMGGMAAGLSEEDIQNVAAYLSRQDGALFTKR